MKALSIAKFGSLDELAVTEVPAPVPRHGEVLVEVRAAAVNPLDVKNALGSVAGTTLPRIPGRDFAGVVVAGPPDLVGKEVWGVGAGGMGITRDGSHAEFLVVPAAGVREKPASLDFQQAAAIGVAYSAAWLGLDRAARLRAGETLLIIGSSGSVGRAATEIAHWRGAIVIGADRVAGQGAVPDHFVNTAAQTLPQAVLDLTGGKGADVAFDTVGGATFEATLQSLGLGGRCVAISSVGQRRISFDLIDFYHQELALFGVDTLKLDAKSAGDILDELRRGFEASAALTPPELRLFPLASAAQAYLAVQAGSGGAKVVLVP